MTRRERWREIIFEAGTPAGKAFDVALLLAILASILAVMLESVVSVRERAGPALHVVEWVLTLLFTAEYVARLAVVEKPARYARSFFGLVDLISILPTYLSLLVPGRTLAARDPEPAFRWRCTGRSSRPRPSAMATSRPPRRSAR